MALTFDLSRYAGATINKAELRLRRAPPAPPSCSRPASNAPGPKATRTATFPGASHLGGRHLLGPSQRHLYTAASGTAGWGTGANAMLDLTGNGADLHGWTKLQQRPQRHRLGDCGRHQPGSRLGQRRQGQLRHARQHRRPHGLPQRDRLRLSARTLRRLPAVQQPDDHRAQHSPPRTSR